MASSSSTPTLPPEILSMIFSHIPLEPARPPVDGSRLSLDTISRHQLQSTFLHALSSFSLASRYYHLAITNMLYASAARFDAAYCSKQTVYEPPPFLSRAIKTSPSSARTLLFARHATSETSCYASPLDEVTWQATLRAVSVCSVDQLKAFTRAVLQHPKTDLLHQNSQGHIALHALVLSGRLLAKPRVLALAEVFLEDRQTAEAQLALVDREGANMMHLAARQGMLCLLEFLVGRCDRRLLEVEDAEGRTPLSIAREKKRGESVRWIERKLGIEVERRTFGDDAGSRLVPREPPRYTYAPPPIYQSYV